jgi:hypothetical protein
MSKNEENSNNKKNENPFSLPEGYFGSFGKKMMHKIELAEELKEFKVLSSIEKKLPFATPDNYFVSSEVRSELSVYPKLSAVKKSTSSADRQNGFVTPELYFETSAEAIKTKIEIAEELKAYPVLYSITKENSFAAPQNYFEGLSHRLREEMAPAREESTVVKVLHLVFNKKTVYAIAATVVISLGIFFYAEGIPYRDNSGEETVSGDCNTLACLQKNDIVKGDYLMTLDEDALMEVVNVDKLSKGLQENLKQSKKESDTQTDKKTNEDYVLENVDVNDIVDEI